MMTKEILIRSLLEDQPSRPAKLAGHAYAPSNIALVKYWGKRNSELNLPVTGSLSIALGEKGAHTQVSFNHHSKHEVLLNNVVITSDTKFYKRLTEFLDLIKPKAEVFYRIETNMNLPVAAGLASSACGFAALVLAFADLYGWNLPQPILSILCRLGSGSACRSLWQGFVEWYGGERSDGLDSFAEPLPFAIPDFAIGLCILTAAEKPIPSREAMNRTTKTSILYESWPKQVMIDLSQMKQALASQDFEAMGEIAERNALAMHASMLSSTPAVCYFLPETLRLMQQVWQLRKEGILVFFTEDAGPNIKLLAKHQDIQKINAQISDVEWLLV